MLKRDPSEVVPTVGMSGRYSLKAPYTALCNPNVLYACTGVVSLSGAVAQGKIPLEDVYLAQGATEADYAADEALDHCIVTLQSGVGEVVTVPNSALIMLPDADGIRYTGLMLGISLSAIPMDLNLTTLKARLSDTVFDQLGVRSTVYEAVTSSATIIGHARHQAIEAARVANVSIHLSPLTEVDQLKTQNLALLAKVALLEAYVKTTLLIP
jgi:hypothetical protein